jgi:Co/Zn/Cd efflux system component
MFGLTASYFLVEIIVGHLTNSMALIADSFHMLSDIAALIIAFISVRMAPKSWDKNTYGWARAEVLGKAFCILKSLFIMRSPRQQQQQDAAAKVYQLSDNKDGC